MKNYTLITGASRGIGREIALELGKRGFNLILHSRSLNHTKELSEALEIYDIDVKRVAAELSDMAQVKSMLKNIDEFDGEVDHVFNNAGIQIAYRHDYLSTPEEDFSQSFLVNTTAAMMITYHFLPKMIKRDYGRIINTTSGIKNEVEQAAYSASKGALDKLTMDLANRLKDSGVNINLTDPGWCRTDLGGQQAPNDVKSTIPGVILPLFLDQANGQLFDAQEYKNMSIDQARNHYMNKY